MTGAVVAPRLPAAREFEPTVALLQYVGDLLAMDSPPPAPEVLRTLAQVFGAAGAGIAYRTEGAVHSVMVAWTDPDAPHALPWQSRMAVLDSLAEHGAPATLEDEGGSWLFWFDAHGGPNGKAILWLNNAERRPWWAQDGAGLVLAGSALRRIGLIGPPCGERVEARLALGAVVASRLSHDFGNVLTSVLGFTELALAQQAAGSRAQGYLQEVYDAAHGGAEWLKKLNFFCRRNPPEFTPAGLPGTLAEEEARLGPGAALPWDADMPADLPALACDAESLRQALRQVLDNAREANGGKGQVHLAARAVDLSAAAAQTLLGRPQPGRYVEITVADCGSGMSDDVRARLFNEWFFSTKPRHRGMGLMMVYGIVHRFGGGLAIEPSAAGGTQVRLYFPAAPEPVPVGPARVLVVDDDPQVLAEARRILEPAGYHVQVAGSAAEAVVLHQAAAAAFDLVLIAVHLPILNGVELARRVRLRDPRAQFLFLHTPAGPPLPRDELVGPATLVHKPLAGPVLLQAVAAVLRHA